MTDEKENDQEDWNQKILCGVDNNTEELIQMRGEGRYFAMNELDSDSDNSFENFTGPKCSNCHRRGHIRVKCTVVICHKCGVEGDHYENNCTNTSVCSRCGKKGHLAQLCNNKKVKQQYCTDCKTYSHGNENCTLIWRSYITNHLAHQVDHLQEPIIYCYNCASSEHFGDECNEVRTSRIINLGSAFSGKNLPKKLKKMYFLLLKKKNIESETMQNKRSLYLSGLKTFTKYNSFKNQNYHLHNSALQLQNIKKSFTSCKNKSMKLNHNQKNDNNYTKSQKLTFQNINDFCKKNTIYNFDKVTNNNLQINNNVFQSNINYSTVNVFPTSSKTILKKNHMNKNSSVIPELVSNNPMNPSVNFSKKIDDKIYHRPTRSGLINNLNFKPTDKSSMNIKNLY